MIENQPNTADYNDVITSFYATSSRLNQFEIDQLCGNWKLHRVNSSGVGDFGAIKSQVN